MNPSEPGMWLLPTKGRVHTNLPRFLKAAIATGVSTPGMIIVEDEEYTAHREAYDALEMPRDWTIWRASMKGTAAVTETARTSVRLIRDFQLAGEPHWIGWLADDLVPETPGWDVRCIEQLNGHNVVSTNDGWLAPRRLNGATVWSAELLNAVGYMWPPGAKHFFIDDMWEALHRMTGCWTCDMSVTVRHEHASRTGVSDDTARLSSSWFEADRRAFLDWQKTDAVPAAERIIALMGEHGVPVMKWDFRGVRLCIATPCGSGRYERGFMNSLNDTIAFIRQFGGEAHLIDIDGCSDVAKARNCLFTAFMGLNDTHLLWIDDDMHWPAQHVGHLLNAGKDFCAIAGPRKVEPLSCAVSVDDDRGNPIPIRYDPATGFLEVTGVGMAFTLMTRAACERLAQSYADLDYDNANGQNEHGVFLPMIVNRQWKSEDFACCYRWRQLGGKVYVAAHLGIGHMGRKLFTGCWNDELATKMAEDARRAA